MKTSSSSVSEPVEPLQGRWDRPPAAPIVDVRAASLRFVTYSDKNYSLKRALLNVFLKRDHSNTSNDFWALRDINLRVQKGERLGIVGSNGAGKSTLLRLLARIYPPTSGSVAVNGSVAPLIEMGAGFNPELSGRENILLNGAMLGINRRLMLRKIDAILEFTGLEAFAAMPLKYYSSGMYMRLAFAIATEVDPELLLIDESLGVGDAAFSAKAKGRIKELLQRSHSVIIVSHDMDSLRDLCTRGLWMSQGRVIADDSIERIVAAYLDHCHTHQSVELVRDRDIIQPLPYV